MNSIIFKSVLALFSVLLLFGNLGCSPSKPKQPNLVLIVVDTLRPDHTGAYGYHRDTTPGIDQLAKESILFKNAICQAAFTLPSMATLFTALNPIEHGVRSHLNPVGEDDFLDSSRITLAEMLKEKGYATSAVVSNSLFSLKTGFDQGFDHYDPGKRRDGGPTTDAALKWLKNRKQNQPFFLWTHYIDPHWPYNAPLDFNRPFTHDDGGRFNRMVFEFEKGRLKSDRIYFNRSMDEDIVKRGIAEYDNEVAYADYHIQRLLKGLKEMGLYENTLIAVISDHGESLGEHGLYFAHSFYLYDTIQKVVFMIKPPGKKAPAEVDAQVRLIDFTPTVLSMLNIRTSAKMRGKDLSPLWTEGKDKPALLNLPAYSESEPRYRVPSGDFRYPERRRAYQEGNEGKWRMIRFKDRKLIFIPGEGMELYDLNEDTKELTNIAEKEPETVKSIRPLLNSILKAEKAAKKTSFKTFDAETIRLLREMGY